MHNGAGPFSVIESLGSRCEDLGRSTRRGKRPLVGGAVGSKSAQSPVVTTQTGEDRVRRPRRGAPIVESRDAEEGRPGARS